MSPFKKSRVFTLQVNVKSDSFIIGFKSQEFYLLEGGIVHGSLKNNVQV